MELLYRDTEKYLHHCRTNRQLAKGTILSYQLSLRHFLKFLEERPNPPSTWNQIRRRDLDDFLAHIQDRYQVSTIRNIFTDIRVFFYYLESEQEDFQNPFRKFRLRLRQPVRVIQSLTQMEMEAILKAAARSQADTAEDRLLKQLIPELLFYFGLRVSELCLLPRSSYHEDTGLFDIKGKGSKDRTMILAYPPLKELLDRYLSLIPPPPESPDLLLLRGGRYPLQGGWVRILLKNQAQEAGITKPVTPHTLRHTFASLLLEEGVDIKYIQEFLGHGSLKITQQYLHTTHQRKKAVLREYHPRSRIHPDQREEENP